MKPALDAFRLALVVVGQIEKFAVVALLINIVVNISAQVVSRYFFDRPLVWVEELATYSFIWATFLGAGLAYKFDRHLRIEFVGGLLGERGQAVLRVFVQAVVIVLSIVLVPTLMAAIEVEMRRMTIALPIQLPIGWFFSVPVLVGFVSVLATAFYYLACDIFLLAGGRAPVPLADSLFRPEPDDEDTESERVLSGKANGGAE